MSTTKDPQQKKAPVIQINQEVLHNNLSDYVRKNLEDVLNELLDAEADRLCHANAMNAMQNGPAPELDLTREILKRLPEK